MIQSPLYSKLQGNYITVSGLTYACRYYGYDYPSVINLRVRGDKIQLPSFNGEYSFLKEKHTREEYQKEFDKRREQRNGSWTIISSNPDSIFINAEGHVLHGKYRVHFVTDTVGYVVKLTTDYIILENDSTQICLTKDK